MTEAAEPDYPESAGKLNLGPVSVLVLVTVDSAGTVIDTTIYKSSNNKAMDAAAIAASRKAKYLPKVVNCQPTQGQGLFVAYFAPEITGADECPAAKAGADKVLLEMRKAKALLSSGDVSQAFVVYKRAENESNIARFKDCYDAHIRASIQLGIAAMGSFIGVLAFQEHQDSQDKCEKMHLESGRYYVAQSWSALSSAGFLNQPSMTLTDEGNQLFHDTSVLARRVSLSLPPLTASDTISNAFVSRYGFYDVPGCDLRFQPRTNWFG